MGILDKFKRNNESKVDDIKENTKSTGEYFTIQEKWLNIGLRRPQAIIDTINEALENMEHLDANIYLGSTKHGNICICLSNDEKKVENVFPVKITKKKFLEIKSEIEEINMENELYKSVTTMFIATDLYNHKNEIKKIIKQDKYEFSYDLFSCYGEGDDVSIDL